MLKIITIGDPHSKVSNQADLRACADRIVPIIDREQPDAVVILGDMGNDHERVYVTALNGMAYFMGRILETRVRVGKKLYCVVGNHDYLHNQMYLTQEHALNVFKPWQSLVIVDKPMRFKTSDGYIVMCPYTPPGRLMEAVESTITGVPVCALFCHQEFIGAQLGAIPSKVGDRWPETAPLAISGHIHGYSSPQPNVRYVGAPFAHSFGEEGEKTISLFTFENGGFTEKRFDLGLPRKLTVELTVAEAETYVVPDNTHVRINLKATTEEYAAFRKTKRFVELSKETKVIPQVTDKITVGSNTQRLGYVDLLRQECQKENEFVQGALEEILNETIAE